MFGKKRIISLSIEDTTARVVAAGNGSVDQWDAFPIPEDLVGNGSIANPQALGQVLRDGLEERELSKGKIVCSHAAVGTVSEMLQLPKIDPSKVQSVVNREARRLSNDTPARYHLYWQAMPSSNEHQRIYVLLIPRKPLRAFLSTLKSAGLKADLVDLKPMALMRTVNQRNAIIANGESSSVDVVIVVRGVPMVMRSVNQPDTSREAADGAARLGYELLQALSSYSESYRSHQLPQDLPVYLTGSFANEESTRLSVSSATNRPVGQLKPPLRYPDDFPVAEYAVNLGLIIRAS